VADLVYVIAMAALIGVAIAVWGAVALRALGVL
jgi:hypothetical protein